VGGVEGGRKTQALTCCALDDTRRPASFNPPADHAIEIAMEGGCRGSQPALFALFREQRVKAERLRDRDGFRNITYMKGYIEDVGLAAGSADAIISNGVINLATDKARVFREAARVLRFGGRLAISDIVTEVQLPENIVCNSTLWAACIGGAAQQSNYRAQIEAAGLHVAKMQDNPEYQFISDNAKGASKKFGVKSVSLLAIKP
jgi:arsenite methyltransferase